MWHFDCFVGIQQWRLDSDASSPTLQKKDEIDSLQSCLSAIPKMKVLIIGREGNSRLGLRICVTTVRFVVYF